MRDRTEADLGLLRAARRRSPSSIRALVNLSRLCLRLWLLLAAAAAGMSCFSVFARAAETESEENETKSIRIIATSDLHGKMLPWDYALNEESPSGSMAQLAAAVQEYRTEDTLLVDAGDTVQDNFAELFLYLDEAHPMVQALNAIGYDVWVTGNHEYNFGMETTKRVMADMNARVLTGNVRDGSGNPIADGYAVFDVDGVRVAVIGMVTPNIQKWDSANLIGYTVTDPLEETEKILDQIEGQYDVLVGVFHEGLENEFEVKNSGVQDILQACPEFDVMVSAHMHTLRQEEIGHTLVVQNRPQAETMTVIDLTLEKDGSGWKVTDRTAQAVKVGDYDCDPAMEKLLAQYDGMARESAVSDIGWLEGDPLAPDNEIDAIPTALIQDTALIDLINQVQLYYSGAQVSAAALLTPLANAAPGKIRRCDVSRIYRFENTLYKLHMNGAQLKKYMEWSASYYNTWDEDDLTISFSPKREIYLYDMFEGVDYEIDISRESGMRIKNLTWPDETPVRDEDEFDIVVNNYRATAQLLNPGVIFEEDELPELVEADVHDEIGGIREMIADYIINVKDGVIRSETDNNWRIIGNEWDENLHEEVVDLLSEGVLSIPDSENGKIFNTSPITVEDLEQAVS